MNGEVRGLICRIADLSLCRCQCFEVVRPSLIAE